MPVQMPHAELHINTTLLLGNTKQYRCFMQYECSLNRWHAVCLKIKSQVLVIESSCCRKSHPRLHKQSKGYVSICLKSSSLFQG